MLKLEEGKHYTKTVWRAATETDPEIPNYECIKCQYATIDFDGPKASMQRHWDTSGKHNHVWAHPKAEEV